MFFPIKTLTKTKKVAPSFEMNVVRMSTFREMVSGASSEEELVPKEEDDEENEGSGADGHPRGGVQRRRVLLVLGRHHRQVLSFAVQL